MTKQKLRNYCAKQLSTPGNDVVLFMDKKQRDLYAAFYFSFDHPELFQFVLVERANSKTPVINTIRLKNWSK